MVYLGLGTNLGNKEQNLRMSVQKIEERIGKIVSLSAFYVTAPWGFASDNSFLNAVVCVETPLRPLEVLKETQAIERELGRTSKSMGGVYSDRLIDIDLLLYGDTIMDEEGLSETPHKKIFIGRPGEFKLERVKNNINELLDVVKIGNKEKLREKLQEVVPTYRNPDEDNEVAATIQ